MENWEINENGEVLSDEEEKRLAQLWDSDEPIPVPEKPAKKKKGTGKKNRKQEEERPDTFLRMYLSASQRDDCERQFYEAYHKYMISTDAAAIEKAEGIMLTHLAHLFGGKVVRTLYGFALGTYGEDVVSDANMKAMIKLRQFKQARADTSNVIAYIGSCYKGVTIDFIRGFRPRIKRGNDPADNPADKPTENPESKFKNKRINIKNPISLENLKESGFEPAVGADLLEAEETNLAAKEIISLYISELMCHDVLIPKSLAAIYSRVLYQISDVLEMYHEDQINDYIAKKWQADSSDPKYFEYINRAYRAVVQPTKSGASPDWGWKKVENKTIHRLFDECETYIRRWDPRCGWSDKMRKKLGDIPEDLRFCDVCTKDTFSKWTVSVHDAALARCLNKIKNSQKLSEYAEMAIPNEQKRRKN